MDLRDWLSVSAILVALASATPAAAQAGGTGSDSGSTAGGLMDVERPARAAIDEREAPRKRKKPALALGLSVLLPGGGQYYNGQALKGGLMTGAASFGLLFAYAGSHHQEDVPPGAWVALGVAGGAWLWSIIDAPLTSQRINEDQSSGQAEHIIQIRREGASFGLDLAPAPQGLATRMTLRF